MPQPPDHRSSEPAHKAQQITTARHILRKAWIDGDALTAEEQRFRLGDYSRSLLWRVAQTLQDPDLLTAADAFYTQLLERDNSLPYLRQDDQHNLRFAVVRTALAYLKQNEPTS